MCANLVFSKKQRALQRRRQLPDGINSLCGDGGVTGCKRQTHKGAASQGVTHRVRFSLTSVIF